jgi:hypothetical protein
MPTLRTLHVLICTWALATSLSACAQSVGNHGAASRQALAAYKEGMRRFEAITPDRSELRAGRTPDKGIDYAAIERLFSRAAAMGLPHGNYGMACAIYASGERERYSEALGHAEKAANANVFEAQVLLVGYHDWGIGTRGSNDAAEKARETAYASLTRDKWPMQSGARGTVIISRRYEAEALAKAILSNGKCAPVTARLTPMSEINALLERARERSLPHDVDLPIRQYVPGENDVHSPDRSEPYPL